MAKKAQPTNLTRWEQSLPSSYETLLDGFHAGMTVSEMAKFFDMDPALVPPRAKDIAIGSFTPDMYADEEFAAFWQTPVKPKQRSVLALMHGDKDIADLQSKLKIPFNPEKLTAQNLAAAAQIQDLGFKQRMGELTSRTFFARINKLKNPETYQKLVNSKANKLFGNILPKTVPYFEILRPEFSLKGLLSPLGKGFYRTGKPKNKEDFIANHGQYGIYGVNDMMRTSIQPFRTQKSRDTDLLNNHINVRNLMVVAAYEGELGMKPTEISDCILYPLSPRASDQFPICMIKGVFKHAGPGSTFLECPIEIQETVLPERDVKQSHAWYNDERNLKAEIESITLDINSKKTRKKKEINQKTMEVVQKRKQLSTLTLQRMELFNTSVGPVIRDVRSYYNAEHEPLANDKLGQFFANKPDTLLGDQYTERNALTVARAEFPVTNDSPRQSCSARLEPGSRVPHIQQALRMMIQRSESDMIPAPAISARTDSPRP